MKKDMLKKEQSVIRKELVELQIILALIVIAVILYFIFG